LSSPLSQLRPIVPSFVQLPELKAALAGARGFNPSGRTGTSSSGLKID
jgi:hypothetical protein